jgi:hypothetical protein
MGAPTHLVEDDLENGGTLMVKNNTRVNRRRLIEADVAFRTYQQKALLRFDLEGTTETIRQQLERISVWDAMGDYAMSDSIRSVVEQERGHQIDLAAALGASAPGVRRGLSRSPSRGFKMSSES